MCHGSSGAYGRPRLAAPVQGHQGVAGGCSVLGAEGFDRRGRLDLDPDQFRGPQHGPRGRGRRMDRER